MNSIELTMTDGSKKVFSGVVIHHYVCNTIHIFKEGSTAIHFKAVSDEWHCYTKTETVYKTRDVLEITHN